VVWSKNFTAVSNFARWRGNFAARADRLFRSRAAMRRLGDQSIIRTTSCNQGVMRVNQRSADSTMEIDPEDIVQVHEGEPVTASTFPVVVDHAPDLAHLVGVEHYPTVRIRVLDARRARLRAIVATAFGACTTILIAAAFARPTRSPDTTAPPSAAAVPPRQELPQPPPRSPVIESPAWVPVLSSSPASSVMDAGHTHSSSKGKKLHR